ncbi:hypothetical protein ACE2PB_004987 [Salmonella enterica]
MVWQTGDEPPSAWLLKVSGGTKQDVSPGIVSTLTDEQNVQQLREQMLADQKTPDGTGSRSRR